MNNKYIIQFNELLIELSHFADLPAEKMFVEINRKYDGMEAKPQTYSYAGRVRISHERALIVYKDFVIEMVLSVGGLHLMSEIDCYDGNGDFIKRIKVPSTFLKKREY